MVKCSSQEGVVGEPQAQWEIPSDHYRIRQIQFHTKIHAEWSLEPSSVQGLEDFTHFLPPPVFFFSMKTKVSVSKLCPRHPIFRAQRWSTLELFRNKFSEIPGRLSCDVTLLKVLFIISARLLQDKSRELHCQLPAF